MRIGGINGKCLRRMEEREREKSRFYADPRLNHGNFLEVTVGENGRMPVNSMQARTGVMGSDIVDRKKRMGLSDSIVLLDSFWL